MVILKNLFRKHTIEETIPLYELSHIKYKVNQIIDYGGSQKKNGNDVAIQRLLVICEDGAEVHDYPSNEMLFCVYWRDMNFFELNPPEKQFVIQTSNTELLQFHSKQAGEIYKQAQKFLNRFIRNRRLKLHLPANPDTCSGNRRALDLTSREKESIGLPQQILKGDAAA